MRRTICDSFPAIALLLSVRSQPPGDGRGTPVILTTLAAIFGPFVGAIARGGQGCCMEASIRLAVIFGPALLVGIIAQFAPLPFKRGREAVRLLLWTCGWATWFFAGFVSFVHALS